MVFLYQEMIFLYVKTILGINNMIKLNNKYVIGTHVMFFEIEMYKDFIDGLINLLETVENKDNVIIDLCFNLILSVNP